MGRAWGRSKAAGFRNSSRCPSSPPSVTRKPEAPAARRARLEGSGTTPISPVVYRLLVSQRKPLLRGGKLIWEKLPVVRPSIISKLSPSDGEKPLKRFTFSVPLSVASQIF